MPISYTLELSLLLQRASMKKSWINISFLVFLFTCTQAQAFYFDSNHMPYAIQEGFCKSDSIDNQKDDCKKYLLAPQDIAETIDLALECKWLQLLISERQDLSDKEGEAGWRKQFEEKCSYVDLQRMQLLQKYWERTDLSLEEKAEFLDALIRLPEALYFDRR